MGERRLHHSSPSFTKAMKSLMSTVKRTGNEKRANKGIDKVQKDPG